MRVVQVSSSCSRVDPLVDCPEGRTVDFERCTGCGFCEHVESSNGQAFLRCTKAPIPVLSADAHSSTNDLASVADETPVLEAITRDVVCLGIDCDLDEAARIFDEEGIDGAPVIENGRVAGILSRTDLLREAFGMPLLGPRGVREAMSRTLLAIDESTSIAQAAALMACEHVHRLPVVSSRGVVVGLLTPENIVRWFDSERRKRG